MVQRRGAGDSRAEEGRRPADGPIQAPKRQWDDCHEREAYIAPWLMLTMFTASMGTRSQKRL